MSLKMRFLWLLFLNLVMVFGSQDDPPCVIEEMGGMTWWTESFRFPDSIDDTHEGIFAEFSCTNVKEVEMRDSKYIKASLDGNKLIFSVTEEFKKFEENESETKIEEHFYMKCLTEETNQLLNEDARAEKEEIEDKEYHVKLTQSINDINTFEPTFTKDEYIFQYYQDLPSSIALTNAQRISAEDKDITTQTNYRSISFKIDDNDYFSITTDRPDENNKRLVHAQVKAKTYIKGPFHKIFTMTVLDSGKPEAKSTTAKLTVQLFTEQTLVFTKSLYQAELVDKDLKIIDGPIAIEGGHDLDTEFEITSEDDIANDFQIKQTFNSITLSLKWSLDPELIESKDYLYLAVTANKLGRIGHFAVMIKVNGDAETTTTDIPATTPNTSGGIVTSLDAFEAWILAGTILVWISFVLLAIAFLLVIFSFKKYWQKQYNL